MNSDLYRLSQEEIDLFPNNFQSLRWFLKGWFKSAPLEDKMNLLYETQRKVHSLIDEVKYYRSLENK